MNYNEYSTLILEHSGSISYICDVQTYELLYMTKASMDLYSIKNPEDYQGQKCHKVLHGLDEPCPFCINSKLSDKQEYRWELYNKILRRWFDNTDFLIRLDGRICHLQLAKDITARKEGVSPLSGLLSMEDVLFRCLHTLSSESNLNTAVNSFLEAIGGYYQASRAYIFEFDLKRQKMDNTFEWCMPGISAAIETLKNIPLEWFSSWIQKLEACGEFSISSLTDELNRDSEDYRLLEAQGIHSLLVAPLRHGNKIVGFLGVDDPKKNIGDFTLLRSVSEFILAELEKRRLMADLEDMSYVDVLTGLKNRNLYTRVLQEYDSHMPDTLGVITVDINGLKGINDTHGQNYGDYVIKQTAKIMQECLPDGLYRIAGDEFVALCVNISKEDFQEKVVALRRAFDADHDCTVSIGCAWSFDDGSINKLLQQADEMRQAEKQSYYHTVLNEGRSISRTGFTGEVLREIEENRFVVFYQPQVDIKTGEIIGAEALVRKKADDGGLIPPNKFIPFYEVGGVISYVDLYVMRAACATMRHWIEEGLSLHISVNFSRVTLMEPNIVNVISGICAENNIPPSSIIIEVTESISKMDDGELKDLLKRLNAAGFTISLDDFGSQYSNLAILATMDFDEIKFDKTLVNTLEKNRKSQVVMKNSVHMCHDLEGTSSLAEGIETKGQLDLLLDYHCDYGQGYYFSKPVSLEEFDVFLERHAKKL